MIAIYELFHHDEQLSEQLSAYKVYRMNNLFYVTVHPYHFSLTNSKRMQNNYLYYLFLIVHVAIMIMSKHQLNQSVNLTDNLNPVS